MKQKIKEILVVEGKNDTNTLQSFFDCDTIETGGDQINEQTIERIQEAIKKRGVIIFTDPDSPGEHIRRKIQERVPGCKHVFIDKEKSVWNMLPEKICGKLYRTLFPLKMKWILCHGKALLSWD